MVTNLVIVESKTKGVTIAKYLNTNPALKHLGKFVVVACFGHIRDLPKKELGIDIDHDFEPKYELLADKKKIIDDLIKQSKSADNVYLASDQDLDGSAISESLRIVLKLGENYKRIVFTEITPKALEYAVLHPGKIDKLQVEGQQCRRIIDRLVGFKLSPLLWKKYSSSSTTLSAGRVQSAVMHMIIQKEREIEAFKTSPYWHVLGDFDLTLQKGGKTNIPDVNLYKGTTIHKIMNEADVSKLFKTIKNKWKVDDIKSRQVKQNPDAPFITSTLQQEGSSKLKISIKRVMQIAQELYEAGHITYMRTDSFNISDDFKASAKEFIDKKYGTEYYEGGVLRKKVVKGAQQSHEAIRCSHVEKTNLDDTKFEKSHKDLYKMIWQRSVGFLMKSAIFDELELTIKDEGLPKDLYFSSSFKKLKFDGFLAVYGIKDEKSIDLENYINNLKSGKYKLDCNKLLAKNTWTSPPARYNDSGIVKLMEQTGIGRPSSYATIVDKLFEKTYVIKTSIKGIEKDSTNYLFDPSKNTIKQVKEKVEVGSEQNKVKPTEIGIQIDDYLSKEFEYIVDKDFTAYMESDLDKIAEGEKTRKGVIGVFWKKFKEDLDEQLANKEKKIAIKAEGKEIIVKGKKYTIRITKYGPVIQSEDNKYISLKSYLMLVKKQYTDIEESDIVFLTSLPKKIATIDGKPAELAYGQFGLYLKYDGKNVGLPKKVVYAIIKGEDVSVEDLRGAINYKKDNPNAAEKYKKKNVEGSTTPKKKIVYKKTK